MIKLLKIKQENVTDITASLIQFHAFRFFHSHFCLFFTCLRACVCMYVLFFFGVLAFDLASLLVAQLLPLNTNHNNQTIMACVFCIFKSFLLLFSLHTVFGLDIDVSKTRIWDPNLDLKCRCWKKMDRGQKNDESLRICLCF